MYDVNVSEQEIEKYMMVDWAKAHERAKRFEEEVELCVEEMRRTLIFFSWNAAEWEKRAQLDTIGKRPSDDIIQGLRAYALHRSAMYQDLIKVFVSDWYPYLKPKDLGAEWLAQYLPLITVWKAWNKIPSIIPISLVQPGVETVDETLSDLDEALEHAGGGSRDTPNVEDELFDDFVQIFVEE